MTLTHSLAIQIGEPNLMQSNISKWVVTGATFVVSALIVWSIERLRDRRARRSVTV